MDGHDRIYAIGDIHGRLDLLDRAVSAIARDIAENGPAALTVTLGDYVDRGPASAGVIDRLAGNPFATPHVALKGNHDALFETFLTDPSAGDHWRRLGALETLHSYGVPVADIRLGRSFAAASQALNAALPETHRAFLGALKTSFVTEHYFFCHAGVRPGIALYRHAR